MQNQVDFFHQPVLLNKVVDLLNIKPGEIYVDATLGGGGHAEAILKQGGRVLGIDQDPEALAFARRRLQTCPAPKGSFGGENAFKAVEGNFADLKQILNQEEVLQAAGILFDLGVSSHQLESKQRGFSFGLDEELDMRMSPKLQVKAADLINGLGRKELYALFTKYGQEKLAAPIIKVILEQRRQAPIKNTKRLADIISKVYEKRRQRIKIHPATKVFQALRIAVNDEINSLKAVLPQAVDILKKDGRLVVISFHELEDRIVKQFLTEQEKSLQILTKKPIMPSIKERRQNPRSRSAKLRGAQKI